MSADLHPIIVVDDDPSMSVAVTRLLGAAGLSTETYDSAEALLDSGKAGMAACFIFDVLLPGLSGFELRGRLMRQGCTQPVIFITAQDDLATRESAKSVGAFGFFPKPFSGREFVAAVVRASRRTDPDRP